VGQLRPFAERRPNGHFLIRKRPLRMAPTNGRFWPKAAVGARAGRMTARGHKATTRDPIENACFRGVSRRRMSAFTGRPNSPPIYFCIRG